MGGHGGVGNGGRAGWEGREEFGRVGGRAEQVRQVPVFTPIHIHLTIKLTKSPQNYPVSPGITFVFIVKSHITEVSLYQLLT